MSEIEINELYAKLECFESCIEQLHREVPKYLASISISNNGPTLVKAIRKVASLESDSGMQNALFLVATKYEILQKELKIFERTQEYATTLLDEAKEKMIFPLKEVISDIKSTSKKLQMQLQSAQQGKDKKNLSVRYENNSACNLHAAQSFPIHAMLFEKHRLNSMKRLIGGMLQAELRFHCRAVEELTLATIAMADIEVPAGNANRE